MKTIVLIFLLCSQALAISCYDVPRENEEWVEGIAFERASTQVYYWESVEMDCFDSKYTKSLRDEPKKAILNDIERAIYYVNVGQGYRTLWRKVYYEVEWM